MIGTPTPPTDTITAQLIRYHSQYIRNYKNLNMEFNEWIGSKMGLTEMEVVNALRKWRSN